MSSKDALNALMNGDAWDFKQAIEDELQDRAMEAIHLKRLEIGANMFDDQEESVNEGLFKSVGIRKAPKRTVGYGTIRGPQRTRKKSTETTKTLTGKAAQKEFDKMDDNDEVTPAMRKKWYGE